MRAISRGENLNPAPAQPHAIITQPGSMVFVRPQTAASISQHCGPETFVHYEKKIEPLKRIDTQAAHGRLRQFTSDSKHSHALCLVADVLENEMKRLEQQLLVASERGNYKIAYFVIHQGVDRMNCRGLLGFTPLHHAAARGHLDIVRLLLDFGWNVDCRNESMETPLHLACFHDHFAIAEYLLDRRADINAQTVELETPLFYATRKNCKQIVRLLIRRQCDIFWKNRYGDIAEAEVDSNDLEEEFALARKDLNHVGVLCNMRKSPETKLTAKLREQILSFLDLKGLCRALQVSYAWYRAADATFLWKNLGISRWEMQLATFIGASNMNFQRLPYAKRPYSCESNGMLCRGKRSSVHFMREH